jgi:iron complex outermembrane receptor protein
VSENKFVEFTDDGKNYDGKHLPGIPKTSCNLQMGWTPLPFLKGEIALSRTGSQFLDDGNSLKHPGYFLANLKVTSRIASGKGRVLRIYAGVNNVTDTRYASMVVVNALATGSGEPRYYYPGQPRNGYAGVAVSF